MVTLHSKRVKITSALRNHARQQAKQITKVGRKIMNIDFFIESVARRKQDVTANKVVVKVQRPGKDVVVRAFGADLYTAISEAADAAARRVRKTQEKLVDRRRSKLSGDYAMMNTYGGPDRSEST